MNFEIKFSLPRYAAQESIFVLVKDFRSLFIDKVTGGYSSIGLTESKKAADIAAAGDIVTVWCDEGKLARVFNNINESRFNIVSVLPCDVLVA